ncbi:MAG TPA: FtsW/RodA/SpoVE family cell cycle protein [Tepidisphaeraceae bacterium]|nr:FtsW/RodA/SpoVE family cell cycle protein [Tepidisphaeraceae bacterium]
MKKFNLNRIWQQLAIATNWPVLVSVLVLAAMGLISIAASDRASAAAHSAQQNNTPRQLIFLGVSLGCMLLFQAVNYQLIGRWGWGLYVISLLLIIYTVIGTKVHVPGVRNVNGAYAWIKFGPASIEPAEIMKLAFVLVLGRYLRYRSNYRTLAGLVGPFGLALVPLVLILKQPDLGMAMIFPPVLLTMLFVAGARVKHLVTIIAAAVLLAPLAWFSGTKNIPILKHGPELVKNYQRERVYAWLDADNKNERQRKAYQTYRAMVAFASGSFAGKGFGNIPVGQTVPESQNDMIFALIGEQFGFFGAMVLLVSYMVLFAAGAEIAAATREPFGKLVAVGVVATMACQTFINLMVCTGLMPVTGITLPFVSYGGSSLVASFMEAGLLLNIGQNRPLVLARESFEFD